MKTILAVIITLHGFIHFMGYAKAFNLAEMNQLTQQISRPAGVIWLITGLLFVLVAVLFFFNKDWWWMPAMVAVILSHLLIIINWQDAKFGTIANAIILLMLTGGFGMWNFHRSFVNEYKEGLVRTSKIPEELLTEADIMHLPLPVQKYIRYSGALNKEKVRNVRICFTGEMRSKTIDWFKISTVQYNFFDHPTRLFYMTGKIKGLTVPGYHRYINGKASMQIKPFGLIPVVNEKGDVLNQAETVTVFNDMCLLVPASLIDKRIKWEETDSLSAKASFTCNGITIAATLYFSKEGQLVNFVSDDRYEVSDNQNKHIRFSTPVKNYKLHNGRYAPAYGEAIWHYPEGEFVYGKFIIETIEYNVGEE